MNKNDFLNLYLLCFPEDDIKDAEKMWLLSTSGKLLCRKVGGKPVAMLMLLPTTFCDEKSYGLYYIFAAGTHPDYRKQGIMEELLKEAYSASLSDGKQGVFLRPATSNLFEYYGKRGFVPFSYYKTKEYAFKKGKAKVFSPDFDTFLNLRRQLLKKPFIEWNEPFLKANFDYFNVFSDGENLLVCEFNDGTLCVRESFGDTDAIISAVAEKFNCEKVLIRHFGSGEPYTLIRTNTNIPSAYIGLTLDAF